MNHVSRRSFLRSASGVLMLPILEANLFPAFAKTAINNGIPTRLAWILMGYGVNAAQWFPTGNGTNYKLPENTKSFDDLKSDISFLQGMSGGPMHNPHCASASFLTGANTKIKQGDGVVFTNTISCDQVAAEALGSDTRHPSLAIGVDLTKHKGRDGHGDRFAYASWGKDGKPTGTYRKIIDIYTALFGNGDNAEQMQYRLARRKSSLDLLRSDAKRLNNKISAEDRSRVEEYFTSIRNIEKRLERSAEWAEKGRPDSKISAPDETLDGRAELEMTFDLLHAAIQSDSTRVITYMLPSAGLLREIGTKIGPHKMSHAVAGTPHKTRDKWLAEQVARFVRKLKETKEANGSSLLDHSLIAYGTSLRSTHNRKNIPMILAGHGGGGLKQGQNINTNGSVNNLWLSMLRKSGVQTDSFSTGTKVVKELGFS